MSKRSSDLDTPASGLRERKKARTRAAIQQQALRLFRERGYAQTTVGEVAEAAEVAESTVFRYFSSKEDLVLSDDFDDRVSAAFRAQPSELGPIEALRRAVHEVYARIPAAELELGRERHRLILSVPQLRSAAINDVAKTAGLIASVVAERCGLGPRDFEVRNMAGAIVGITISAMFASAEDPSVDYVELMDQGMAHLAAGLPLPVREPVGSGAA